MKFTHFLKVLPFFMGLLLPQSLEYALISLNNACYIHCSFFFKFQLNSNDFRVFSVQWIVYMQSIKCSSPMNPSICTYIITFS